MSTISKSLVLLLTAFILSGCGGSSQGNESLAVSPEPTPTENQVDLAAKEAIKNQVLAYVDFKCTPKYKTRVSDLGDGIVLRIKEMNVFNEDKFGIFNQNPDFGQKDEYLIVDDPADSTYGNLAVRAAYLSSAYHNSLAGLYTDIYDTWASELKPYRKNYERFKKISDRTGKKLCPIVKKSYDLDALDPTDLAKVQIIYDELAGSWPGFKTWWAAVDQISQNVSDRVSLENEEAMTPKCDEYPTADGKYVVVKCTVPPG